MSFSLRSSTPNRWASTLQRNLFLQINQKQKGGTVRNDRVFAVPRDSHEDKGLKDVRDLSKAIRQELEKFFIATDDSKRRNCKSSAGKAPRPR
jgi:inorganic pyrophosphatase